MKSGCRSCALVAASSSALGINRRKITHTSTSRWAMPVRSSAPIALRYFVSIRAWAHMKLIRQIAFTVTWTELKSSNAASLVMLPAANQRHAPPSRSLGAVHDGYERSELPITDIRRCSDAARPAVCAARARASTRLSLSRWRLAHQTLCPRSSSLAGWSVIQSTSIRVEEVWQAMLLPYLGVRAIRTSTLPMLTHFTTVCS